MGRTRTYLDHNATAPLRTEARAAMLAALDVTGNPSSVHGEGRAAKAVVERARAQVAEGVGCTPDEVIFTSGATEAASVLSHMQEVFVAPTAHDALWAHDATAGRPSGTARVFAMGLANSETGVITQPPERVEGRWPVAAGADAELLLLDITQAVGRVPFAFGWSGADLALLASHKIGGPKGVGALIVREGLDIPPVSVGGGQEMSRRSGTENVAGIAGFGAAMAAAQRDLAEGRWAPVEKLRNILESTLEAAAPETKFFGQESERLPNTSCFAMAGWKGETQVMAMDLAGYAVSAGSACSSGKVRPSRVLAAMGADEETARSAIRVSLGLETTEEEVMGFAEAWIRTYQRWRQRAA
ncbi:MAG: aminotransferase class V-fold PLP-dependent enzyme [Pseudomonadota bacterium]